MGLRSCVVDVMPRWGTCFLQIARLTKGFTVHLVLHSVIAQNFFRARPDPVKKAHHSWVHFLERVDSNLALDFESDEGLDFWVTGTKG